MKSHFFEQHVPQFAHFKLACMDFSTPTKSTEEEEEEDGGGEESSSTSSGSEPSPPPPTKPCLLLVTYVSLTRVMGRIKNHCLSPCNSEWGIDHFTAPFHTHIATSVNYAQFYDEGSESGSGSEGRGEGGMV